MTQASGRKVLLESRVGKTPRGCHYPHSGCQGAANALASMNTVDIEMVPHHRSVAVLFNLKYIPLSISGVHIHPVYA